MAEEPGDRRRIRRALLSVHDKAGLSALAHALAGRGVELWATDGTRKGLSDVAPPVRSAEELTGIGSWFDGRIKTLHPGVLGGILAPRTAAGRSELESRGLREFDLVVVNFYPFVEHVRSSPQANDREEYIDIGGVTLARAAAKNHAFVAVLSDPIDYPAFLEEYERLDGALEASTRRALAVRAFARCTDYDAAIAAGLSSVTSSVAGFPPELELHREPMALRYGENPHQAAAVYVGRSTVGETLRSEEFDVLKGEALSYNNLLDLDAALAIVAEYAEPAAAIVKHSTPCGIARAATVSEALGQAIATDPVARYGCAIAVNRPLGAADLGALHGVFVDLLAAPAVDAAAREQLGRRPKLKLVRAEVPSGERPRWEARSAMGRLLVQESDRRQLLPSEFRQVTTQAATADERGALDFAWRAVRHAKSNAIVLVQGGRTVGIGSGQPTRVKAVELAIEVAGERARGSVLASDAFFPFADGVEAAGRAGVRAILQPGGSLRDPEVIRAADQHGMAMYFTGWRVFRH
ncbi:MAG TPA: bifunctional phosphoribosylaminoimidazolecarboxamide formyltransferase/IMP cyclohydrolase [Thermoplasmata archaeon]|nr:bifunctional phosphoribosylaminoimidazolecarboxamide formyltransferase/IMP cyclohydrolase [Thermoplasmata archaeon]